MNSDITFQQLNHLIKNNQVLIFSESSCHQAQVLKDVFNTLNVEFTTVELDLVENGEDLKRVLANKIKNKNIPQVFIGGDLIGDYEEFMKINEDGLLNEIMLSLNIIK